MSDSSPHSRREQILRLFEADPRRIADCVVGLEGQYEVACRDRDTFKRGVNENADMVDSLREQLEALQEAVASSMSSLASDPMSDGYAYSVLEAASNPASKPSTPPENPSYQLDRKGRIVSNQDKSPD